MCLLGSLLGWFVTKLVLDFLISCLIVSVSSWLVGMLTGLVIVWLVGWSVGGWVGSLFDCSVGQLSVGKLVACFPPYLVGRLVAWLVGWLIGGLFFVCLVGWLVLWVSCFGGCLDGWLLVCLLSYSVCYVGEWLNIFLLGRRISSLVLCLVV